MPRTFVPEGLDLHWNHQLGKRGYILETVSSRLPTDPRVDSVLGPFEVLLGYSDITSQPLYRKMIKKRGFAMEQDIQCELITTH